MATVEYGQPAGPEGWGHAVKVHEENAGSIGRWVRRYLTPRNGTLHNPTPEYCWPVKVERRGKERHEGNFSTLRAAKRALRDA